MNCPDNVLLHPQILDLPLLLLANKQDTPGSMSVQEIRENYEVWWQNKLEEARERGEDGGASARQERVASLDVMGISALEGYVIHSSKNCVEIN